MSAQPEHQDEYDQLLREAYLGEILGDAFFAALADKQPDPNRREKLETLQIVEARTATSLRRLVGGNLGAAEDDARSSGRDLAAGLKPEEWDGFIDGLLQFLPDFLRKFERLRDIARQPPDPALVALVNHERAIERFAQYERDGDEKRALWPLQRHLRNPA